MTADYLVLLIVVMAVFVNRHSKVFFALFILSELPHLLNTSPVYDNAVLSVSFAYAAYLSGGMKIQLQYSLCFYAVIFWLSAVDFWLTEQETVFYVIFPYAIKLIDIYVIYHLINKEQRNVGIHSASHCTFN